MAPFDPPVVLGPGESGAGVCPAPLAGQSLAEEVASRRAEDEARKSRTSFAISFAEAVCDRIEERSPQARKPSAWGMLGPVRTWLGGEHSPAAFVRACCYASFSCIPGALQLPRQWLSAF